MIRGMFLWRSIYTYTSKISTTGTGTVNAKNIRLLKPLFGRYKSTSAKPETTHIDKELVERLERLALVDFSSEAGIHELSDTVRHANELQEADTTGVEAMESPLHNRSLYMREDLVTEGNCRQAILRNASKTEEDYFSAPPGNIPLASSKKE